MSEKSMPNIGLDLQRIHRVITRGLAVSQENCQAFAESGFPDATTAEGFWKYCLGPGSERPRPSHGRGRTVLPLSCGSGCPTLTLTP